MSYKMVSNNMISHAVKHWARTTLVKFISQKIHTKSWTLFWGIGNLLHVDEKWLCYNKIWRCSWERHSYQTVFFYIMKIHNCQTKCDILLVIHAYQAVITTGDMTICSEMDMDGHKDHLCASCWCGGGKNMSSCGVWWIIAWMKMSYTSVIFCRANIGWNCGLFNISAPKKDMPLSSKYGCWKEWLIQFWQNSMIPHKIEKHWSYSTHWGLNIMTNILQIMLSNTFYINNFF